MAEPFLNPPEGETQLSAGRGRAGYPTKELFGDLNTLAEFINFLGTFKDVGSLAAAGIPAKLAKYVTTAKFGKSGNDFLMKRSWPVQMETYDSKGNRVFNFDLKPIAEQLQFPGMRENRSIPYAAVNWAQSDPTPLSMQSLPTNVRGKQLPYSNSAEQRAMYDSIANAVRELGVERLFFKPMQGFKDVRNGRPMAENARSRAFQRMAGAEGSAPVKSEGFLNLQDYPVTMRVGDRKEKGSNDVADNVAEALEQLMLPLRGK